jgi:hypothetical protein
LATGFLGTAASAEGREHDQGQGRLVDDGGARMVKVEHGLTFKRIRKNESRINQLLAIFMANIILICKINFVFSPFLALQPL